jgi:glycosyltransferase involved in cell wall biosynthesis
VRLLIDMQGAQTASRFRGIGRYSLALVDRILADARDHQVFILLNSELGAVDPLIKRFLRFLHRDHIILFEPMRALAWSDSANHWRGKAMEVVREALIVKHDPDVVLVTSFFEGYDDDASTSIGVLPCEIATAVIHYDLIPTSHPDYLQTENQRVFYTRKCQQLRSADLLLTISGASMREVIKELGVSDGSVVNISAAVEREFYAVGSVGKSDQQLLVRHGIKKPYVLCTPGGFDQRKNLERLMESFAGLPEPLKERHQLVIPGRLDEGRESYLTASAVERGLDPAALKLVGYVSDEELRCLYTCAALFVFPSLHEGFGLPVLEAMACGAPVIASNTSSLPELVGNAHALFDPLDVYSITEKMELALTDSVFRRELSERGLKQAAQFSWQKTASEALCALEALAAQKSTMAKSVQNGLSGNDRKRLEEMLKMPEGLPADASKGELAECLARHFALSPKPQLLIDITQLRAQDSKTGIQRVVRSLLLAFINSPPEGYCASPIYYHGGSFRHAGGFRARFHENISEHDSSDAQPYDQVDEIVDFSPGDVYLSLDFNLSSTPQAEDYLRQLSRRGVRLCFVLYDMLPMLRPDWWPAGMRLRFEVWLRCLSEIADTVCCISNTVAGEFRFWLDQARVQVQHANPKIRHFHLGADLASSAPTLGWPPDYDRLCLQLSIGKTFLMVGTVEPRKGHAQVLAGFDELWVSGADVNLVIVGKAGWMVEDVMAALDAHSQKGVRLFWLPSASDECLEDLYARADCLIAASEGEGFGLPLIEAAQHGLAIIARDLPVFREVAADGAMYFGGTTSSDVAEAIFRWLRLFESGVAPDSSLVDWLTWQESASQLSVALELGPLAQRPSTPERIAC